MLLLVIVVATVTTTAVRSNTSLILQEERFSRSTMNSYGWGGGHVWRLCLQFIGPLAWMTPSPILCMRSQLLAIPAVCWRLGSAMEMFARLSARKKQRITKVVSKASYAQSLVRYPPSRCREKGGTPTTTLALLVTSLVCYISIAGVIVGGCS